MEVFSTPPSLFLKSRASRPEPRAELEADSAPELHLPPRAQVALEIRVEVRIGERRDVDRRDLPVGNRRTEDGDLVELRVLHQPLVRVEQIDQVEDVEGDLRL